MWQSEGEMIILSPHYIWRPSPGLEEAGNSPHKKRRTYEIQEFSSPLFREKQWHFPTFLCRPPPLSFQHVPYSDSPSKATLLTYSLSLQSSDLRREKERERERENVKRRERERTSCLSCSILASVSTTTDQGVGLLKFQNGKRTF